MANKCPHCNHEMKRVVYVNQFGETKLTQYECPYCRLKL